MGTVLSRIILPPQDDEERSPLYYRSNGEVRLKQGKLEISHGSIVRFNTYFNGFFYPKYLDYSYVSEISMCIWITGEVRVKAICWTKDQREFVLYEKRGSGFNEKIHLPVLRLKTLPYGGALFLEMEAISQTAFFHTGWYETDNSSVHPVHVAAVICTYRREHYVMQNLERIKHSIWENESCPIRNNFDLFIVDNGKSLILDETPHVHLFPNRNYGGSGGFTRGLIEAYRRKESYTHVLFMDDDISFETEVLVKTVQLLRFAKELDRPLWIGGQMLIEDQPTIQFEAGSFYRHGRLEPVNRGLDVSKLNNLLLNEKDHHVQYNAWWYCCMPVDSVEKGGLPLPLFIKTDDVEYGLRQAPHVVLMNGIGIWHMAFSQKYSPHLEYYIKRNELIVSAIHCQSNSLCLGLWKLIRAAGKAILIGDTRTVDFLLDAYRDFLKGPDFFLQSDEEELNHQLINKKQLLGKSRIRSILTDPFRLIPVLGYFMFHYTRVQQAYQTRLPELTSLAFWCGHLGI